MCPFQFYQEALHHKKEDFQLLNILFPDEIVVAIVLRLKSEKADRQNGLLAEHLKWNLFGVAV